MAGIWARIFGREVNAIGYFVGTFDFSSSNQFCTSTICGVAWPPLASP